MTITAGLIVALALAALIGISLGAFGSGGSIVTLPVLVYVAGIPAHEAVEMSLAIVGGTSLLGAYLHFRQGRFHARAVLLFALAGGIGAYYGSRLTHLVQAHVLMSIFGALMFLVGILMLRTPAERQPGGACHLGRCLAVGAVVGVLTGFLGVGGGFLIVPALILAAGLDSKQAVGSSLAIISLNSIAGLASHLSYRTLELGVTLAFLAVALLGLGLGLGFCGRMAERSVRRSFGWLVLAMSLVIGVLNLRYFL